MIKAVLFDMDGVITDTEKLLSVYWCKAANSLGFPMTPEHVLGIRSLSAKYAVGHLKGIFGEDFDYFEVRRRRIELMNEHIKKYGVEKKKGVDELLCYIKSAGLKCAVCTATDRQRTDWYLGMIGVADKFDDFITGDMIANGKPAPDTYLTGAAKLGLEPCECIALEDSPNGIQSAYDAGCLPVMIPDLSQPDEKLKEKLFAVCDDLTGVIGVIEKIRAQEKAQSKDAVLL